MKKEEKVEIKYIKQSTAISIALICIFVGFIAGNIYSVYKAGNRAGGQSVQVSPGVSGADNYTLHQSLQQIPGNKSQQRQCLDGFRDHVPEKQATTRCHPGI